MFELPGDSNQARLRKDVSTRWTSTHEMIQSFIGKFSVINKWLRYLNRTDIALTEAEEQFLPYLSEFFGIFALITKSIEGSQYSTINLSVIFLEELRTQLTEKIENLTEIEIEENFRSDLLFMYESSLSNLEKRLFITDEMVCATLLDPIFQHCHYVQQYLINRNTSRNVFLRKMYEKYVGEYHEDNTRSVNLVKKPSFIQNLARKYSKATTASGIDIEIDNFLKTDDESQIDVTSWWGLIGRHQFPILARLARIIFSLSATSANVERLNSAAGATLTKFRCNLHHSKFEKLMIVYYNYPHFEKSMK